jgi:hypothetical protein
MDSPKTDAEGSKSRLMAASTTGVYRYRRVRVARPRGCRLADSGAVGLSLGRAGDAWLHTECGGEPGRNPGQSPEVTGGRSPDVRFRPPPRGVGRANERWSRNPGGPGPALHHPIRPGKPRQDGTAGAFLCPRRSDGSRAASIRRAAETDQAVALCIVSTRLLTAPAEV